MTFLTFLPPCRYLRQDGVSGDMMVYSDHELHRGFIQGKGDNDKVMLSLYKKNSIIDFVQESIDQC